MGNKILSLVFTLVLLSSSIIIINKVNAHSPGGKEHDPIKCIPPEKRTMIEREYCKILLKSHRLCKLEEHCAILKLEEQQKKIGDLEDKLGGVGECGDLPFNHKSNSKANIHQKANSNSEVIINIDKGDDLLFYAPSTKDENWYYVKVKKINSTCADGYIKAKYVVKKEEATDDVVVEVKKAELIKILKPKLQKNGKLMVIDAEGTLSITGAVTEDKIDEILVNEEEEVINDDNTFTYLLFVPSEGAEIRIIGKNNGEVVKELSFKIKVGK